jgi:hypothetical protein
MTESPVMCSSSSVCGDHGVCDTVSDVCQCAILYTGRLCDTIDLSPFVPVHRLMIALWAIAALYSLYRLLAIATRWRHYQQGSRILGQQAREAQARDAAVAAAAIAAAAAHAVMTTPIDNGMVFNHTNNNNNGNVGVMIASPPNGTNGTNGTTQNNNNTGVSSAAIGSTGSSAPFSSPHANSHPVAHAFSPNNNNVNNAQNNGGVSPPGGRHAWARLPETIPIIVASAPLSPAPVVGQFRARTLSSSTRSEILSPLWRRCCSCCNGGGDADRASPYVYNSTDRAQHHNHHPQHGGGGGNNGRAIGDNGSSTQFAALLSTTLLSGAGIGIASLFGDSEWPPVALRPWIISAVTFCFAAVNFTVRRILLAAARVHAPTASWLRVLDTVAVIFFVPVLAVLILGFTNVTSMVPIIFNGMSALYAAFLLIGTGRWMRLLTSIMRATSRHSSRGLATLQRTVRLLKWIVAEGVVMLIIAVVFDAATKWPMISSIVFILELVLLLTICLQVSHSFSFIQIITHTNIKCCMAYSCVLIDHNGNGSNT